jgi:hypothetical protein
VLKVSSLHDYRSYQSNTHVPFAATFGPIYNSQPVHIFGFGPQRSGTLRNTTLPGQPVTSSRSPNISICNLPELNTAAPQRPKGTFDVHLPIKASNPRGHDSAPLIIGNSHQLALGEISPIRQPNHALRTSNICRQGTCKAKPSQISAIFSVTNEKNMAKVPKYHAPYAAPSLLARPHVIHTKGREFAQDLSKKD